MQPRGIGCAVPRLRSSLLRLPAEALPLSGPAGEWEAAHAMRNRLLEHVRQAAGAATLLDITR